ncbi:Uncharacterised protein [Klebsiella aerogenes]|nr:Uncharacterised protein [Klebsiella aerogenes]
MASCGGCGSGCVEKRYGDIARAVAPVAAQPPEAGTGTLRDTLQLTRIQRRIRRHHDDDRTGITLRCLSCQQRCNHFTESHTVKRERAERAKIRQHQHSQRGIERRNNTRGRADPALQIKTAHPASCANAAAGKVRCGCMQCFLRHRLTDGQRLNIIEPAVVALQGQRVHRRQRPPEFRVTTDGIPYQRGKQRAHRQRVTEQNRRV